NNASVSTMCWRCAVASLASTSVAPLPPASRMRVRCDGSSSGMISVGAKRIFIRQTLVEATYLVKSFQHASRNTPPLGPNSLAAELLHFQVENSGEVTAMAEKPMIFAVTVGLAAATLLT